MLHSSAPAPLKPLVLASANPGKLREFQDLLAGLPFDVSSLGQLELPSPEETGDSFRANAILKARHAASLSGCAAIADDSGLEVDALGGAPGIYSARYAGASADDAQNNAKLLQALEGLPFKRRQARYRCALAFIEAGRLTLRSRTGKDITATYPELGGLGNAIGRRRGSENVRQNLLAIDEMDILEIGAIEIQKIEYVVAKPILTTKTQTMPSPTEPTLMQRRMSRSPWTVDVGSEDATTRKGGAHGVLRSNTPLFVIVWHCLRITNTCTVDTDRGFIRIIIFTIFSYPPYPSGDESGLNHATV